MGLDCYFVKPAAPGDTAPEPDWSDYYPNEPRRTPNVCSGLLNGNGADGSFRGKVYADFVEELTSYSLYEELDNNAVKAISEALDNYWKELQSRPENEREAKLRSINGYEGFREYLEVPDSPFAVATEDINWRELEDFVIMFRAFAELGLWLARLVVNKKLALHLEGFPFCKEDRRLLEGIPCPTYSGKVVVKPYVRTENSAGRLFDTVCAPLQFFNRLGCVDIST